MEITAPQDGRVLQLAVHTIGAGYFTARNGYGHCTIERQSRYRSPGQPGTNRSSFAQPGSPLAIPAFDRRTTPEINGTLKLISADRIVDTSSGTATAYYLVRININDGELARLEGKTLVPGMRLKLSTNRGSHHHVLLVKPMVDQITHAFKER